ncbi:Oxidoreductase, aldo/keto reductase family protein [Dirofilaria immitis]|nr:Oxidoreductase, aldo/keto reductase family protein [Dirofilaria immitis]
MTKCGTVKLATGADLPLFGLGTWLSTDPAALTTALKTAFDTGYRLIDTAYIYRNEAIIGQLPLMAHKPDEVEEMVKKQLEDLQVDYFDLYLIHCPCPCKHRPGDTPDNCKLLLEDGHAVPELVDHLETWKVLEKLYKEGKLKVEVHIYWPQKELHELCKKNNITMTSFSTLGSPGRTSFNPDFSWPIGEPMKDPLVLELAAKYKKSPAQICIIIQSSDFDFVVDNILLRHMIQRGICVIPKSINPDRVIENFSIFDFKLTEKEIDQLDNVKTRVRLFLLICKLFDHPWYPFKDVDLSKMKRVYLTKI